MKSIFGQPSGAATWTGSWPWLSGKLQNRGSRQSSAIDALHVAAAHLAAADEFITTARAEKPLFRTKLVKVSYLFE